MLEVEVSPLITYMIVFFFLIDVDIAVAFLSLLDFSSKGNSLLLVSHLTETKKKKKERGKKKNAHGKKTVFLFSFSSFVLQVELCACRSTTVVLIFFFFFSSLFFQGREQNLREAE